MPFLRAAAALGRIPQGRCRAAYLPDDGIAVLAQGTGSFSGGGLAAEIAADLLAAGLRQERARPAPERMAAAGARAHRAVRQAGELDGHYRGMAAAVAAVALDGWRLHVGHAGDVRVYRVRGAEVERVTEDHVLPDVPSVLARALGCEPFALEARTLDVQLADVLVVITREARGRVRERDLAAVATLAAEHAASHLAGPAGACLVARVEP